MLVGLALTGCAPAASPAGASATPTGSPAEASPSPIPTPSPTPADELVLTLDDITYVHGGGSEVIPYSDGASVLSLFAGLTGVTPEGEKVEGQFAWVDPDHRSYTWSEVSLGVSGTGEAGIRVTAETVAGVPIRTEQGISVGSTRADVLAAGALEEYDDDNDGVADVLALGAREVPGTQSLSRPGSVGIEYITVLMDGDQVESIISNGNDFSDI